MYVIGIYTLTSDILYKPALVVQLDVHPMDDQEVVGSTPTGLTTFLVDIESEIFSMIIFSLLLVQADAFSFWQKNVYSSSKLLRGLSLSIKRVVR